MGALNARTMELYEGLAEEGVEFEFSRAGILVVFRDRGRAEERREELEAVAAMGASVWREVDEGEIHELEPMLRPGFSYGFFVESDGHVRPESLTAGLGEALRGAGVEIHEGVRVMGFREEGRRVTAVRTNDGELDVDAVVLAAGASTGVLTRMLGWKIPLTAGKGYSVTIEGPKSRLRQPLYLGDAHVGLTPFEGALRFGGTMELSGVNARLDPARVRLLRRAVERDVDIPEAREGGREWVGMRPMVPDTLPEVGRLPSRENVYVNVGHQMSGVTLGPSTGEVVAGMVVGARSRQGSSGGVPPNVAGMTTLLSPSDTQLFVLRHSSSIPGRENRYISTSSVKRCRALTSSGEKGSSSWAASLPSRRIRCAHSARSVVIAPALAARSIRVLRDPVSSGRMVLRAISRVFLNIIPAASGAVPTMLTASEYRWLTWSGRCLGGISGCGWMSTKNRASRILPRSGPLKIPRAARPQNPHASREYRSYAPLTCGLS